MYDENNKEYREHEKSQVLARQFFKKAADLGNEHAKKAYENTLKRSNGGGGCSIM